jgi:hypothetical protein
MSDSPANAEAETKASIAALSRPFRFELKHQLCGLASQFAGDDHVQLRAGFAIQVTGAARIIVMSAGSRCTVDENELPSCTSKSPPLTATPPLPHLFESSRPNRVSISVERPDTVRFATTLVGTILGCLNRPGMSGDLLV